MTGSASIMLKLSRIAALIVVCSESVAVQRRAVAAEGSATYGGKVVQFLKDRVSGGVDETGSERVGVLASICKRLPASWFANDPYATSAGLYEVVQRHLCDTNDAASQTASSESVPHAPVRSTWAPVAPVDFTGPPTASPRSMNLAAVGPDRVQVPSSSSDTWSSESTTPVKLLRSEPSVVEGTPSVELLLPNYVPPRSIGVGLFEDGSDSHARRDRVLFFIATDDSMEEVSQIKRNLGHARSALGQDCCDVYFAHYATANKTRSSMDIWSTDWYLDNVVGYLKEPGYKFSLLQKVVQHEVSLAHRYEFVWPMDSDIDLTKSDLQAFFRYVRCTQALIVGPTFRNSGERQKTDHRCLFRHSDFVELTAPLFRASTLVALMTSPLAFQAPLNRTSDWGLDLIWCKLSAQLHNISSDHVCALVDATPLAHAAAEDGGAIESKADVTRMFFALRQARLRSFPRYESKYLVHLSCHDTCADSRTGGSL